MRPAMHHLSVSAARADALFVSALQRSEELSTGQVRRLGRPLVRQPRLRRTGGTGVRRSPGHGCRADALGPNGGS